MKTTPQAFRPHGSRLGLIVAAVLAVSAFATASSAAAATQHWAGTPQQPFAGSKSFTGQAYGKFELSVKIGVVPVKMACTGLAASGTASNPAGASGTLGTESWALEGCTINVAYCAVEKGRIAFEPLQAVTSEEAGKDLVSFSPKSGATATVIHLNSAGGVCPLGTELTVTGSFAASARAESPGQYHLESGPAHLQVGTQTLNMEGEFKLFGTGKEALVLSSFRTPGVPHWFLGAINWTALTAGKSTVYASSGPASFSIQSKISGGKEVRITCSGAGNGISGSLENPSGGGAGTATATVSFGACETDIAGCSVQPANSYELAGVATEVGGHPAVEFKGSKGAEVVKFEFSESCGFSQAVFRGKLIATSEGDGNFNFAASELKSGLFSAVTGGTATLKSGAGEYLRLQP